MEYRQIIQFQISNQSNGQTQSQQISQNIELLPCYIHQEQGNFLTEICVKKDCKKIFNLSCIDCMRKEHSDQNHTLNDFISLKRFVSKLNQFSQSPLQFQKYNNILKPSVELLNKQAKELVIKIDQLRAQLQKLVEEIVKLVGQEQEYTKKQQDELNILRQKQTDFYQLKQRKEIDEYLKMMNQLVTVTDVDGGDFVLELKSADQDKKENDARISQNQKQCDESSKMLVEIDAQIVDIINKLKSFDVKAVDQYFHTKLEFSESLKHPNIKIIQRDTVQQTGNGQYNFCLSGSKLPTNQDSTWAYSINQSTNSYIMLGVAHPEIIQQQGFTSNLKGLNNGYYFLYCVGYTYTHFKQEENNKFYNLGFKAGDIIYILFQPTKNKIYFCKNKTKPYISITLSPDRDDYQPCVALCQQNDRVQILNNDEYKFDL